MSLISSLLVSRTKIARVAHVFMALCIAPIALAQTPAPHAPSLTVNARLVVLDTVVTDKQGHPVDGLTREDFQVFEDDVVQPIRSFEPPSAHVLPPNLANSADAATQVFDPAKPATFGQSPTTILILDQLNTRFADSSFARRQLQEYLNKQPAVLAQPTTLVTVYQDHFKLLQEFTRDRTKLQAALTKAPVEYPWGLETYGNADHGPIERLDATLRALEEIAQEYARIPGRKNLIWIGGGFPTLDPTEIAAKDDIEMKDTLKHVTNVLLDARVTLYAVDPTTTAKGMTEIIDPMQMMFAMATGDAGVTDIDPVDEGGNFDSLGLLTGGRVIRSMNNVTQQIATAVDFGAHFYTIGYSPTNASNDALKFRHIKVICTRPGLFVMTRSGYYAGHSATEDANTTMEYDLSTAAESTVRLNGLHVTAELNASVAVLNDAWILHVAAPGLTWTPQDDGSSKTSVEVMAVSLNNKGKMIDHVLHSMTVTARPGVDLRDEAKIANFDFTAKPATKAVSMRFVVRDASTGRMGSFDVPVKP